MVGFFLSRAHFNVSQHILPSRSPPGSRGLPAPGGFSAWIKGRGGGFPQNLCEQLEAQLAALEWRVEPVTFQIAL